MRAFLVGILLLCLPATVRAEEMVTSHFKAKQPHIAAHRTLPIGTKLKVTNPKNGKSKEVTIGTRGPFIKGRHLDISKTYAMELGFGKSGVLRLQTEVVQ